jgi:hypothetical protein
MPAARLPAGLRLEPALQAATAVKLWRCEQEQSGIHKERFGAQASIYGLQRSEEHPAAAMEVEGYGASHMHTAGPAGAGFACIGFVKIDCRNGRSVGWCLGVADCELEP